jgi:hypothetical protein
MGLTSTAPIGDDEDAPRIKLRPKHTKPPFPAAAAPVPEPLAPLSTELPPDIAGLAPPPPPGRGAMPPVSVLSAPPPPGSQIEPPAPPGAVPKLSLGALPETKLPPGAKPSVKPAVKPSDVAPKPKRSFFKRGPKVPKAPKAGAAASPLKKRSALSPVAKAGVGALVLAVVVGAFFAYRIFFTPPPPPVPIKVSPIAKKPDASKDPNTIAKIAAQPGKLIDQGVNALEKKRQQNQAKMDAIANGEEAPTGEPTTTEYVQATVAKDVKVNNAPVMANSTASSAFKAWVADAAIGGVFQGKPSRALINGKICREGSTVDSDLGIIFDRIDAERKVIYFKDVSGAEGSKAY